MASTARKPVSLRARALRLLGRREHSRLELERKLAPHCEQPEQLKVLLGELMDAGWLSETRLADQAVLSAQGRYGPRRVLQRLRDKGVGAEALERIRDDLARQELANAREVWRKRFGQPPADWKARARQARFLEGRGFSGEVIRKVLGGDQQDE